MQEITPQKRVTVGPNANCGCGCSCGFPGSYAQSIAVTVAIYYALQ